MAMIRCFQSWGGTPRKAMFVGCGIAAAMCAGVSLGHAATYYVAPTGNSTNLGTIDQPFATMARAQQAAVPGDTVYFRAGTYRFVSSTAVDGVLVNKSGVAGNRIKYWAYPNEVPIFDFSGITTLDRITGLRVTASWVHIKGLEIKLVPQNITTQNESWGIYNIGGTNNIYEMLNLHHNMGPGFFLVSGGNLVGEVRRQPAQMARISPSDAGL